MASFPMTISPSINTLVATPPTPTHPQVINSTVNIQQRILRLYELVENDLYGRLQSCATQIAGFKVW